MIGTALHITTHLFLGMLVALGGFAWCPCDHAHDTEPVIEVVAETPHACCSSGASGTSVPEKSESPQDSKEHSEPCGHCDGGVWVASCSQDAATLVAAVNHSAGHGSDMFFGKVMRLTSEDHWPLENVGPAQASLKPLSNADTSLRAVHVLLTV